MKYSFIFCYRDREEHAKRTLPWIRAYFRKTPKDYYEIIVVEQADSKPFRRGNLLNEGARVAKGDLLIFHDIDYCPCPSTQYYEEGYDCYLPVGCARFVYNDSKLTPKPIEEVPAGYRHFIDGCDSRMGKVPGEQIFFGAVETFTREAFFKINGFSSKFVGWGGEDGDLRERVNYFGLKWKRGSNLFYVLDHPDSGPPPDDKNFNNNLYTAQQWQFYLPHGVDNQPSTSEIVAPPEWANELVDKWVKATDFDPPAPPTHIVSSTFNWDEGDE